MNIYEPNKSMNSNENGIMSKGVMYIPVDRNKNYSPSINLEHSVNSKDNHSEHIKSLSTSNNK